MAHRISAAPGTRVVELQAASRAVVQRRTQPALHSAEEAFVKAFNAIALAEHLQMLRPAARTPAVNRKVPPHELMPVRFMRAACVARVHRAVHRFLPPLAVFAMKPSAAATARGLRPFRTQTTLYSRLKPGSNRVDPPLPPRLPETPFRQASAAPEAVRRSR